MAGPKIRRWIGACLGVVGGFAIIGCWLGDLVNAGPLLPPPIKKTESETEATPWSPVEPAGHTAPVVPPMIPLPSPKVEEPAEIPLPPPPQPAQPEVQPPTPPMSLPKPVELPKPIEMPKPNIEPTPQPKVIPTIEMPELVPQPIAKPTPKPETIDVAPMPRKIVQPPPPAQPMEVPDDLRLPKPPSEFTVNPKPVASPSTLLPSPRKVSGVTEFQSTSIKTIENHPRETAMTFPNKELTLSTLLGVALAISPMHAIAQEQSTKIVPVADPAMKQDMQTLKADVKQLQEFHKDFSDLLYGKADGIVGENPGVLKLLADMDKRLKSIEDRLTTMETALKNVKESKSAFTPEEKATPSKIQGSAVKIQNDYPVEISIVINDESHRVGAGESKIVPVPSGSYKYEILSTGSQPTTKIISEGEMVTLHIH